MQCIDEIAYENVEIQGERFAKNFISVDLWFEYCEDRNDGFTGCAPEQEKEIFLEQNDVKLFLIIDQKIVDLKNRDNPV